MDRKLYPYRLKNKWGYCDASKHIVITCEYDFCWPFVDKLAAVYKNSKWGIINLDGEKITDQIFECSDYSFDGSDFGQYTNPLSFYEGICKVSIGAKSGAIDQYGSIVIEPRFLNIDNSSEGLIGAQDILSQKWGFIARDGNWKIDPQYISIKSFSCGLAPVWVDGNWTYINPQNKRFIGHFFEANEFSEGVAAIVSIYPHLKHRWGYIDTNGNNLCDFEFIWADNFNDGEAIVRSPKDSTPYYIDRSFKPIGIDIPNIGFYRKYHFGYYIAGRYKFSEEGKFGFKDMNGNIIVPAIYDSVTEFTQGQSLALVRFGKSYGYINAEGITYWED